MTDEFRYPMGHCFTNTIELATAIAYRLQQGF
uniref:Uncharacterized protein n=1 Tax=Arundo donax TaxID=35708 RepID=A0A0A8Y6R1_ARUDO